MSATEIPRTASRADLDREAGVLRCELCGDVIGAYEALVACQGTRARLTSRAAEPQLSAAESTYYHRPCYPRRR